MSRSIPFNQPPTLGMEPANQAIKNCRFLKKTARESLYTLSSGSSVKICVYLLFAIQQQDDDNFVPAPGQLILSESTDTEVLALTIGPKGHHLRHHCKANVEKQSQSECTPGSSPAFVLLFPSPQKFITLSSSAYRNDRKTGSLPGIETVTVIFALNLHLSARAPKAPK